MQHRLNFFNVFILKHFLFLYRQRRSNTLRQLIKKILGNKKINIYYNGFIVNAGLKSAIESNLIFDSYNEIVVLEVIREYVLKGYHFIDIGANIGIHSLMAAKYNSEIEIYSFEPDTQNFLDLIKNISLNGFRNIRPFRMGLGNSIGQIPLNINEGWNKGKHSIKIVFNDSRKTILIPITKLDCFKENIKSSSLVIKIDVEGFEKEVLEGSKQLLIEKDNIVVIIELLSEINGFSGCTEIMELLKECAFESIYKIQPNNSLIKVFDYTGSGDYILIKGKDSLFNSFVISN